MKFLWVIGLYLFAVFFRELHADVHLQNETLERVDLTLSAQDAIRQTKKNIDWIVKRTLPMVLEASDQMRLSGECLQSLMSVSVGLKQMKDWAAKMLDSSSKIPSGILLGTTTGMGSYDECVDTIVRDEKASKNRLTEELPEKFRGQYCLIDVWPPKSLSKSIEVVANNSGIKNFDTTFWKVFPERSGFGDRFRIALGVCSPSTCSKEDILKLAVYVTKSIGFGATINDCAVKKPLTVNKNQIAVACFLTPLALFIVIGTLFEFLMSFRKSEEEAEKNATGPLIRTLTAFSLLSNTKKFLNVYRAENSLSALAGIRFFCVTWIILGHSYYFPHLAHYAKFKDMFTVTETQFDLLFMAIQNTALAVDSFFLVSGFLTSYSTLKKMKKTGGKLKAVPFFLKRIMRMLPAQFLVMGLLVLMPLFGSGPLWNITWQQPIENCERVWWSNIFFIQNFWGLEDMCLFHTWFIAVAMQLHVMTFFILGILYRWPVFGITVNLILTVAGAIGVALVTYFYELPPTFSVETNDFPKFHDFYNNVYTQIYSHLGSYCIGVLLGYYMNMKSNSKIDAVRRFLLWAFATALGLATVYGLYAFTGGQWTRQAPLAHVMYAATFRTGWALAVAWVVFDCAVNNHSLVNRILSWQAFAVLDRLTFMAYLLHPLVMYFYQARMRELLNTDYVDMIYYFLATTVVTYIISFLFHVAVEQPVNFLDTLLFNPLRDRTPDEHQQNVGHEKTKYNSNLHALSESQQCKSIFVVPNPMKSSFDGS